MRQDMIRLSIIDINELSYMDYELFCFILFHMFRCMFTDAKETSKLFRVQCIVENFVHLCPSLGHSFVVGRWLAMLGQLSCSLQALSIKCW